MKKLHFFKLSENIDTFCIRISKAFLEGGENLQITIARNSLERERVREREIKSERVRDRESERKKEREKVKKRKKGKRKIIIYSLDNNRHYSIKLSFNICCHNF